MTRASDAARNGPNSGTGNSGPGNSGSGNSGSGNSGSGSSGSGNSGSANAGPGSSGPGGSGSTGSGSGGSSRPGSANPGAGYQGSVPGKGPSGGSASGGNPGSGGPGSGLAPTGGGSRPPISPGLPTGPPRSRQPLPGPPPGMRMPGPPMPAGLRFAPQPPPRRHLTGGQRSKLVLLTVVLLAIGAVLGYAASLVLPSQYAARTSIQYNIAGENTGDFLKTDRNLTTQVVLLTSRNVLGPVADANGVSVDSLTKQVSATILNASDIIQLQVKNSDPNTAVTLANAIAKQYLTVANGSGPQGYLQGQLDAVKKQQTATGTTAADLAALTTRAATLQAQLDQLNLTQNQSSVLVPAYALTDPVSPNKTLAGLTGGVCGLIIALMTVVTLSRRWSRN